MIASLAEAVGHEAFEDSERANSLQFSVEVGILPLYNLETGLQVGAVSIQWLEIATGSPLQCIASREWLRTIRNGLLAVISY